MTGCGGMSPLFAPAGYRFLLRLIAKWTLSLRIKKCIHKYFRGLVNKFRNNLLFKMEGKKFLKTQVKIRATRFLGDWQ